jgi:ABC-2 type transport system permease protein
MLAKTSGAIVFGAANAAVPLLMAACFADLSQVASTFLGLFIAVSVSEVFEAQTFSNFFRFPMIFLCGLFFPIAKLPMFLRPLSYLLPVTYGADLLHRSIHAAGTMPLALDFAVLGAFCIGLFALSLGNVRRRWVL